MPWTLFFHEDINYCFQKRIGYIFFGEVNHRGVLPTVRILRTFLYWNNSGPKRVEKPCLSKNYFQMAMSQPLNSYVTPGTLFWGHQPTLNLGFIPKIRVSPKNKEAWPRVMPDWRYRRNTTSKQKTKRTRTRTHKTKQSKTKNKSKLPRR